MSPLPGPGVLPFFPRPKGLGLDSLSRPPLPTSPLCPLPPCCPALPGQGAAQPGGPPSPARPPCPWGPPVCLSPSISNHCCARLPMCCPQLGPAPQLTSLFSGSSPCCLAGRRGELSPRTPQLSSCHRLQTRKGARPRSCLSQRSLSGPCAPIPQLSHKPGDQTQASHTPLCSPNQGGRQPSLRGRAQDPGAGGSSVPGQLGRSSCPSSGVLAPPSPHCEVRPMGGLRPLPFGSLAPVSEEERRVIAWTFLTCRWEARRGQRY